MPRRPPHIHCSTPTNLTWSTTGSLSFTWSSFIFSLPGSAFPPPNKCELAAPHPSSLTPRRRDCCLLSNYSVCLEFIFKWPVVWFIRPVKTESLAVDRACWETIDKSREWGDDLLTTKPVDEKEDALVLITKQRLLLRLHYYYTNNETARHWLLYPVINKPLYTSMQLESLSLILSGLLSSRFLRHLSYGSSNCTKIS